MSFDVVIMFLKCSVLAGFSTTETDVIMMTLSNGNIFRVTGPLCGEFTGHRWIPHKGQRCGALIFSLICAWINDWVNNREAGDLRRHRTHNDVIVMSRYSDLKLSYVMKTQLSLVQEKVHCLLGAQPFGKQHWFITKWKLTKKQAFRFKS